MCYRLVTFLYLFKTEYNKNRVNVDFVSFTKFETIHMYCIIRLVVLHNEEKTQSRHSIIHKIGLGLFHTITTG